MDWESRYIQEIVERALNEDVGAGNVTVAATVDPNTRSRAHIEAKQELVCAGLPLAVRVFRELDPDMRFAACVEEGQKVGRDGELLRLTGKASGILTGERTALNFLERLSGIATLTQQFVDEIAVTGAKIQVTRNATPGMRVLEQYAVRMGGGANWRGGLFDAVFLERNHIVLAGGVKAALDQAHSYASLRTHPRAMTAYEAVGMTPSGAEANALPVQIAVANENELREALSAGAEWLLLTDVQPEQARLCVRMARGIRPDCVVEIGGRITLANVRAYAEARPDYLAVDAITQSEPSAELTLLVDCRL